MSFFLIINYLTPVKRNVNNRFLNVRLTFQYQDNDVYYQNRSPGSGGAIFVHLAVPSPLARDGIISIIGHMSTIIYIYIYIYMYIYIYIYIYICVYNYLYLFKTNLYM